MAGLATEWSECWILITWMILNAWYISETFWNWDQRLLIQSKTPVQPVLAKTRCRSDAKTRCANLQPRNKLLASILQHLGFHVQPLASRVFQDDGQTPRSALGWGVGIWWDVTSPINWFGISMWHFPGYDCDHWIFPDYQPRLPTPPVQTHMCLRLSESGLSEKPVDPSISLDSWLYWSINGWWWMDNGCFWNSQKMFTVNCSVPEGPNTWYWSPKHTPENTQKIQLEFLGMSNNPMISHHNPIKNPPFFLVK